ncbi:Rossmann-like and DUF2520 domain-containing protein [Clostridium taeniosporum]|uniref:DUF2520 domain-containing protein n=1 Tax=Clostridium taeniosporum TaxID=394958 RepID=A0A1D7XJX0_9CLOT|nr:Rossmann-like and DUF2520 domain-containing protein [Clostridium taeniosporum]AOR23632.1 DUF2520 domain-containing protein [Clostridium taeniosporum]
MLYHTKFLGGDTIKIGFIGPGKVGVSLGRYFTHKGINVTGFYGRNLENTIKAAKSTKSKVYCSLKNIIEESNILFITTPDDTISIIDTEISSFNFNLKNKSICHTSGSLSSNLLSNVKHSGALTYSIHPIYAFSSKNTDLKELENIYFSIEGENINENDEIITLMKILNNKYFVRSINTYSSYHLATVFVSNLVLSLLEIGTNYFKEFGLSEKEALEALKPLIMGNINNIFAEGFVKSLTGPVSRGDITPIQKHLSVLREDHKNVYKELSLNLLNLVALKMSLKTDNTAHEKNKELELKNLLENSNEYKYIYKILGGIEL